MALTPDNLYSYEFASKLLAAVLTRAYVAQVNLDTREVAEMQQMISRSEVNARFYILLTKFVMELLDKKFCIVGVNMFTQDQPYQGDSPQQGLSTPVTVDYVISKVDIPKLPVVGQPLTDCGDSLAVFLCQALNSMHSLYKPECVSVQSKCDHYYTKQASQWQGTLIQSSYKDYINNTQYDTREQVIFNPIPMALGLVNAAVSDIAYSQLEQVSYGNNYIAGDLYKHTQQFSVMQYQFIIDLSRYAYYNHKPDLSTVFSYDFSWNDFSKYGFIVKNGTPFKIKLYGYAPTSEPVVNVKNHAEFQDQYYMDRYYGYTGNSFLKSKKVQNCKGFGLYDFGEIQQNGYSDLTVKFNLQLIPLSIIQPPFQIPNDIPSPEEDAHHSNYDYLRIVVKWSCTPVGFVTFTFPF